MKSPAETLIERSPHWHSLMTGKPRVGACYRCAQKAELTECCGSWGLIEWLCQGCRGRGGPTVADPNRLYCKDDQTCCDFACGN